MSTVKKPRLDFFLPLCESAHSKHPFLVNCTIPARFFELKFPSDKNRKRLSFPKLSVGRYFPRYLAASIEMKIEKNESVRKMHGFGFSWQTGPSLRESPVSFIFSSAGNSSCADIVAGIVTVGEIRDFDNVAGVRSVNELAVAYVNTGMTDVAAVR